MDSTVDRAEACSAERSSAAASQNLLLHASVLHALQQGAAVTPSSHALEQGEQGVARQSSTMRSETPLAFHWAEA